MFQNLQKKLTFLYTLTTGAILTVILIICFFYMKSSMEARYKAQFSSVFLNISNRFQTEAFFTDSWLSQMEMDNSLLIHIEENDTPLFFRGAFQPETSRETLLKKARKKAVEEGITSHKAALSSPCSLLSLPSKAPRGILILACVSWCPQRLVTSLFLSYRILRLSPDSFYGRAYSSCSQVFPVSFCCIWQAGGPLEKPCCL